MSENPILMSGTAMVKQLESFEAITHQSIIPPFARISFITNSIFLQGADSKTIRETDWEIRSFRVADGTSMQLEITIQKHLEEYEQKTADEIISKFDDIRSEHSFRIQKIRPKERKST